MKHYVETKQNNELVRRVDVTEASSKKINSLKIFLKKMFPQAITYNLISDQELEHDYKENN